MQARTSTLLTLLFILSGVMPLFSQDGCNPTVAQIELAANNARARLAQGGALWAGGEATNGSYVFPASGQASAIYSGGIWLGGMRHNGGLSLAASTYKTSGHTDFWAGPLMQSSGGVGTIDATSCANWDRFFSVDRSDIDAFRADWADGTLDNPIPESIKRWPAIGNPFFEDINGFVLPNQALAPFFDENNDGIYNPSEGDYPATKEADKAIWWVFNDVGNDHGQTNGQNKLYVEVQMMAYAYASDMEAVNNTTFYDVRIISKGSEVLDSAYFSIWIDPDLGCYTDDYAGCSPENNMAFIYNADAIDGEAGCSCPFNTPAYCEDIPMIAIKSLQGFQTAVSGEEGLDMSSFVVYNNSSVNTSEHTEPNTVEEYAWLMTGRWKDGSPLLDPVGNETAFLYPGVPNDTVGWSMCSEGTQSNDIRLLMNFGSFRFEPGDVYDATIAVIGVEQVPHPCPSLDPILSASAEVENFYNEVTTATQELFWEQEAVRVSPNPMTRAAVISLIDNSAIIHSIRIYDTQGKIVNEALHIDANTYLFEKKNLPPGMYFFRLISSEGKIGVGKIVIR